MLKIWFGEKDNVIFNTSAYFKNDMDFHWLSDPFVRDMIRDVDKSTVLSNGAIESPVMGIIPPASLSGGVKTLILIYEEPEKIFNATNCGDNCAKWLLEIGRRKDITINLRYLMEFGDGPFDIVIMNTGETVHDMKTLIIEAGEFV